MSIEKIILDENNKVISLKRAVRSYLKKVLSNKSYCILEFEKVNEGIKTAIYISIFEKNEFSENSENKIVEFKYQTIKNWSKVNGLFQYSNILDILNDLHVIFEKHIISYSPYTDLDNCKKEDDLKEILKDKKIKFFKFLCFQDKEPFKVIYSLSDYVKNVQEKQSLMSIKYNLYFRGQCLKWSIVPSLFREKEWVESEANLNEIVISDRPNDFNDCKTPFENLVRLKHYDQPSRLLDLTSSPMNALFFACNSGIRNSESGIVYYCSSSISDEKYSSISDTVTMLTAITKTVNKCSDCKSNFCKKNEGNAEECGLLREISYQARKISPGTNWQDLTLEKLQKCIIVRPPMNNTRIVQQHGLFIMCGRNNKNPNLCLERLEEFFTYKGSVSGLVIPAFMNKALLSELDRFGVNEYYIYGDLERKIKVEKLRVLPIPTNKEHNVLSQDLEIEKNPEKEPITILKNNFTEEESKVFNAFMDELYAGLGNITKKSEFYEKYSDVYSFLNSVYDSNKLYDEIKVNKVLRGIIKNDIFSYYNDKIVTTKNLLKFLNTFPSTGMKEPKSNIIINNIKSKLLDKYRTLDTDDIPF